MKPEELWTAVDYWNDLQKGDLEVETYIRVGDELAEYAALLEAENKAATTHIREIIETTKAQRTEIEDLIADLTEEQVNANTD